MPQTAAPPSLILTGPTGIGKTRLALQLGARSGAEIISADSMQVYRGMPIGTAQPSADELAQARFHLCGVVDPAEAFQCAALP
jgi:tRNA dimethylallyltransferase